jgi:hypothetical protein
MMLVPVNILSNVARVASNEFAIHAKYEYVQVGRCEHPARSAFATATDGRRAVLVRWKEDLGARAESFVATINQAGIPDFRSIPCLPGQMEPCCVVEEDGTDRVRFLGPCDGGGYTVQRSEIVQITNVLAVFGGSLAVDGPPQPFGFDPRLLGHLIRVMANIVGTSMGISIAPSDHHLRPMRLEGRAADGRLTVEAMIMPTVLAPEMPR